MLVLCRTGDDTSSLLVPYIVDAFQFVWINPWFEGFFVLSLFSVCYRDCSYEYFFWEYDDVFIVARSLIIVWSSGQCISLTVSLSRDVMYLEVKLHQV